MTPSRTYSLSEANLRCMKINLEVKNDGIRLMIYAAGGSLLRGFQLWFRSSQIDADDFDKWWRFMGYDNEIHA